MHGTIDVDGLQVGLLQLPYRVSQGTKRGDLPNQDSQRA